MTPEDNRPLADVFGAQPSWRSLAEQPTATLARHLKACADSEQRDDQAAFIWRLHMIRHVRALYDHVQLPASNPDHISSKEWVEACKATARVRRTQAHGIVQRRLAEPFQTQEIVARVSEMERIAAERRKPCEYPKIGKLLSWFPDPRGIERQKKPARVTAQDAHITELEGTIETLHAEKGDLVREERLLILVILAQQIEIERLRGFKVVDDRKPRAGLDPKAMAEGWDAEMRKRYPHLDDS